MFDISDPKMLWLNIANIALGILTLVCWVLVGYRLVQEVLERKRKSKNTPAASDDHTFLNPGIGITMADGGERVDIISRMVLKKKKTGGSKSNQKHNPNN